MNYEHIKGIRHLVFYKFRTLKQNVFGHKFEDIWDVRGDETRWLITGQRREKLSHDKINALFVTSRTLEMMG